MYDGLMAYQKATVSTQWYIRVLLLLHGVESEIICVMQYVYNVYVFSILAW